MNNFFKVVAMIISREIFPECIVITPANQQLLHSNF
jgi:hypothetical protein